MSARRLLLLVLLTATLGAAPRAVAQEAESSTPTDETVANLAAGRVVIAVVKNAILVATVENPIEAETRPPTPVPISSTRLGVLLGPVLWWSPSAKVEIARLDQELPQMRSHLNAVEPHIQEAQGGEEATDIESIGQGLLERLTDVAQTLHARVDLPANEPFVELVLVDYLPGYGPEIWQLSYRMKQSEQQSGFWITRILRPAYLQFWPPEKGQPRTLVEFSYPPESVPQPLLDLIRQKDPRIEKIIASDPRMAQVAGLFLQGDSSRISVADATQFLRAALDAIAPPDARETLAMITQDKGCEWILAPPPEPKTHLIPNERPAGAPTLQKPPE